MIRGTLCVILVILSLLPAIPFSSQTHHYQPGGQTHSLPIVPGHDPNGTRFAFNTSRAQFDLYTQLNAISTPGTPINWFGGNFTNPQNGTPILGTTFNVTIPSGAPAASDNVTFSKVLNVPKGNVSSTTYLRFDWRGSLSDFTKVSYFIYNDTTSIHQLTKINQTSISGGEGSSFTAGSPPVGCGPNDNCYDVTNFLGFNLTLVFAFNSTQGKRLSIRVSNVAIVSADGLPINSYSHSMGLDTNDLTSMTVNHKSDLSIPTGYFANVTYPKPHGASGHLNHTWSNMILSFYYPNSYATVKVVQNGTTIFPTTLPASPIFQGNCPASFYCTNSHLVSISNSTGIKHSLIIITANSVNLGADVKTTLGGIPTTAWGTGDLLQVRVTLRQGVNVTGSDTVTANKASAQVTQTFANTKEGISLLNFTSPLPQSASLFGVWTVNSTYSNMYDFGYNATSFTLQQLGVTGFAYSGSNQHLNTQGTLTYSPTNPTSINVNGYVFAIDTGAGPAPLTSPPTIPSGTGVYVSNISLVNGVFTTGQQLMVVFTLVNPSGGTKMNSNANLTIDHEYTSMTTHQSRMTIPLPSGYDTFTLNSKYVYELNATFTPAGIQVVVRGLNVGGSSLSALLPPGNPPVTGLRQHAGLFKIAITTEPLSGTGACVPSCSNSLESPAYAYVLVNPPVPGRLLTSGSFTSSSTTGAFSTILSSGRILGASKLTFLTLGTDSSGFAITVQGQSSQESTLLQSTLDSIPSVTQNQPSTLVLHLKSNSTTLNMNLNVTLNIQDSNLKTIVTKTMSGIIIGPGQSKDVQFAFSAPSSVGTYTVTFLSPDYGAPLITGTLQVAVLPGNLQVLIPAIIGVAAAIVMLLFFLFRKKPTPSPETTTKDKPGGSKPKPNP